MKKSLVLGILGVGAFAASSYGQGFIHLDNYVGDGATGGLVTYGSAGIPANGVSGAAGVLGTGLLSGWTVGLYYVLGTPSIVDPPSSGTPISPLVLGTGTGSTIDVFSSTGIPGQFTPSSGFAVPGGAAGGTVTLELLAYDTAGGSYAGAQYRGHSAPFTLVMDGAFTLPPTANVGPAFSTFGSTPVPEPTTLALAGLGGLASLVALRRKQA
jgi:hypothetical protein